MTLADTSVWVDHFRRGNAELRARLEEGEVAIRPQIIGELACGTLPDRERMLHLLRGLPRLRQIPDDVVHAAIEAGRWWSAGIGWTDAHLLASSLAESIRLWTLDRRLAQLYALTAPGT